MQHVELLFNHLYPFVSEKTIYSFKEEINRHLHALHNKTGKGNDFLGWINLPSSTTDIEITEIENTAKVLSNKIDILVVIGIGGSYLGSKSIIEALSHNFTHLIEQRNTPIILFAGQHINEDYLHELLEVLNKKRYALVVVSKSGTTTEPAIAFRILKNHLEKKIGKNKAKNQIIAITDKKKGALKKLSDKEGYKSFVIPNDVGGRYSVLTPAGLLPLAIDGINIRELINGAKQMEDLTSQEVPFENNPAALYAAARNALYQNGKTIEILVNYNSKLQFLSEWWKQLFGESQGKENKGIFPANVNYTTDLHSMGQYVQEGARNIFETVISVKNAKHKLYIPFEEDDSDGLNYLTSKHIFEINKIAEIGTSLAHADGGVPIIQIKIPKINEFYLGQLLYFFEKACAISGYILGVNPFDQPGVEAYKNNMFALLEKPGFEKETAEIKKKINH